MTENGSAVNASATVSDVEAPDTPSPWRTLPVIMAGAFMAILDTFIVLVATPTIRAELHATSAELEFVLAGYQIVYAMLLITGARLGDRYGRKRVFLSGMALFTVASIACAAAPTALALIIARLFQGAGSALMFPQIFSMIQVLVLPEKRARAFGVLAAVIGTSTITGQLVGGALIGANLFGATWRPVFWVNVPIGVVILLLATRLVPENRAPQSRRFDVAGVAVLTIAIFLLILPLIEGRELGWPAWAWLSLAASAVALVIFALVERRVEAGGGTPLVSLRLFTMRPFTVGISLVFTAYAGLYSFFLILSLTLQSGLGLSPLAAGLVYTPEAVTFFIFSLIAGQVPIRYGRWLLGLGSVIYAIGFAATAVVATAAGAHVTGLLLIPTLIVQGFGAALLFGPMFNAVLSQMRPSEAGMASGVLSTTQQVGGAVGVAIIGVLFFGVVGTAVSGGAAGQYAHALSIAVLFNVALALIGAGLVLALPRLGVPART